MEKKLQVGVKILLKNKENKYLLLQRSTEKYPEAGGQWDIPGGRIDIGTTLFDNLKREIKEETQLELVKQPKLLAAQDIILEDKHVVRLTYVGEIEGEPILDSDHTDYQWVSRENMEDVQNLDRFVKKILNSL